MVTFDNEDALRTMRQGALILTVLTAVVFVCNLCGLRIVGDFFIGYILGHLLHRILWISRKIRAAHSKTITLAEVRIMNQGLFKRDVQ